MHLVDGVDDLAAVVDGDDRIVVARRRCRCRRFGAHRAGEQRSAPAAASSPIAASASGRSVKRNGTEVSGQTISCGAGDPSSGGARRQVEQSWRRSRSRTLSSHFSDRSIDGCTMRTASVRRRLGQPGQPPGAEAEHGRDDQRSASRPRRPRVAAPPAAPAWRRRRRASAFMPMTPTSETALHQERRRHCSEADRDSTGKPVNRKVRSHSASPKPKASAAIAADAVGPEAAGPAPARSHRRWQEAPECLQRRAAAPRRSCRPRPAARCRSTRARQGNSRSRTTSRSRRPAPGAGQRSRVAATVAPSSSQTRTGKDTKPTAKKSNGACVSTGKRAGDESQPGAAPAPQQNYPPSQALHARSRSCLASFRADRPRI